MDEPRRKSCKDGNKESVKKKGTSAIISAVILSAAVLVLGIVAWSFAVDAGRMFQQSYYGEVGPRIESLKERFIIERVTFNDGIIHVWIYNCGKVEIEVRDLYIFIGGEIIHSESFQEPITVSMKEISEMSFSASVQSGDPIVVKAISVKGNEAYESYKIP